MAKYIKTPTEKKLEECERKFNDLVLCDGCNKHFCKDECANGLCESCRKFYLDDCCKEFGID